MQFEDIVSGFNITIILYGPSVLVHKKDIHKPASLPYSCIALVISNKNVCSKMTASWARYKQLNMIDKIYVCTYFVLHWNCGGHQITQHF